MRKEKRSSINNSNYESDQSEMHELLYDRKYEDTWHRKGQKLQKRLKRASTKDLINLKLTEF